MTESARPGVENTLGSIAPGVVRNGAFLLLAYLLPRGLTFASVVVAARVLEAGAFGAYSTAAAYAVVLSVVATLGMLPLLVREIARSPERAPSLLRTAHRLKTVSNVVMLAALLGLARGVLNYPDPVLAAAVLLGVAYAIGAYVENFAAYFQAVERMEVWMQASAIMGVVWAGLGTILVVATSSLVWFCLAPVLGQLAGLAWLLIRSPASVRRGAPTDSRDLLAFGRALLPFAAGTVVLTVYYKADILLLAAWRTDVEVGIYAAAYKFVDIWQAIAIVGVSAAYPRLSRLAQRAPLDRRWPATRLAEVVLLASIPLAATLWIAREPLTGTLFGAGYRQSAPVLGILALVLPALSINILGGYVLAARGRMGHAAALYAGGAALNVGLNVVMIPTLGAFGAARAMVVSEVALAVGFTAALQAHAAAPGARAAAVAAGAALLWGGGVLLPESVPAALAVSLYLGLVALLYRRFRAITGRELRAMRLGLGIPPADRQASLPLA